MTTTKKNWVLEACVDSAESALAAAAGGATRLELCANLIIGGTTPSPALFRQVNEETGLPVHVLIRPRFGDFLYTEREFRQMLADIEYFSRQGAAAVVVGALLPDGSLDRERMAEMVRAAGAAKVTLHRAFDVCCDPVEALEVAVDLGINTILTSGQQANCRAGMDLIGQLLEKAAGRIEILIGGGVSTAVIREFREALPMARAFHLSGKTVLPSGMLYRNERVNMGLPGISEFQIWRTEEATIRKAAEILEATDGSL